MAGRRSHRHPPLLRDRRAEHLARLPALRAAAWPAVARAARGGSGAGARAAAGLVRAAPQGIPARLGGRGVSAAAGAPAEECASVTGLTHEGEGVVRGGKTAFVAGALPGERIRFRRTRRHRSHDDAELLEVITPSA